MDWSEQGRRWGATFLGDGRVRFRLWAPSQPSVSVAFDDRNVDMRPVADGWFEANVAGLAHGTAYRYRLADGTCVADPASAAQRDDVFGPSLVIDQQRYRWRDDGWRGRPWHQAVIYEVHIGTTGGPGRNDFRTIFGRIVSITFSKRRYSLVAEIGGFSEIQRFQLTQLASSNSRENSGLANVRDVPSARFPSTAKTALCSFVFGFTSLSPG